MAGGRKGQRQFHIPAAGGRRTEGGTCLGPTNGHATAQCKRGGQHDQKEGPEERREAGQGPKGSHDRQGRGGGIPCGARFSSGEAGQAGKGDKSTDGAAQGRP
eukprot:3668076-Heterocapsa_arctica.AAC.1